MGYSIVTYPDERLKLLSTNVDFIDDEIKKLVEEMYNIMYITDGIGLSAVQVGVHKRLFIMDIPGKGKHVMINPVITEKSKELSTYEEGCLSLPGISAEVTRPKKIKLDYIDINGKNSTIKASGLLATCIQHEYDHLDGRLFVDLLPPDERVSILREYRKINSL